jgi:hypothetical protein
LQRELLGALKTVQSRLQADPLVFGEPRYHLRNANLEIRVGNARFLSVRYGVDVSRRLVYVVDFIGSPGQGL